MGNVCNCTKLSPEEREARLRSKYIEEMNKRTFQTEAQVIKLLLLGAGESGKSTLFKQMKILYSTEGKGEAKGFSEKERAALRVVVFNNIILNLRQLFLDQNSTEIDEKYANDKEIGKIYQVKDVADLPWPEVSALLEKCAKLWKEDYVQDIWKNRGHIQVQDSLEYYMSHIDRINVKQFEPTDQDILRTRVRTSGIVEDTFQMQDTKFLMVDVGGQRNERRKWIHSFENVDCIIFVAALSEYNQYLYEDNSVNRQDEALELFHKVANEPFFKDNGLVLFLNKSDLFREKLLLAPFRVETGPEKRNTEYTGPVVNLESSVPDSEDREPGQVYDDPTRDPQSEEFNQIYLQSLQYLENLYRKQCPPNKPVFIKVTCATDTKQIDHIMNACKEIFLRKFLKNTGFT
eukprot:maker-scaffold_1-snap-gene-29.52-mRNA-1 protein AED:0.02 eAED:0.02 QI:139/1/1/1/1/1/3/201/403